MILKKVTVNDLGILNYWFNKDHVTEFFGESIEWINEIEENINNSDWVHYFIVFTSDSPIGFVQYYETHKAPKGIWSNEPEGTVGIDYLIGEEDYLHKGFGTKIVKSLIWLIQHTNKYKYIVADPIAENKTSVSVLLNNGFIKQNHGLYKFTLK